MWMHIVFWILLVPLLVLLFIVYFKSRKLYRLAYILSIFTYTMSVMYFIDAYSLGRNSIILLLAFSAILMTYLGYHFHKLSITKPKNIFQASTLYSAIVCMVLIVIIAFLSALPIGFETYEETVSSLKSTDVFEIHQEGDAVIRMPKLGPVVHRITFVNKFIPRQKLLSRVNACLYNSQTKYGAYLGARWQLSPEARGFDFRDQENYVELGLETKSIELRVEQQTRWVPRHEKDVKPIPIKIEETYDTLVLFFDQNTGFAKWHQCDNLQQTEIDEAKKIKLV